VDPHSGSILGHQLGTVQRRLNVYLLLDLASPEHCGGCLELIDLYIQLDGYRYQVSLTRIKLIR
jgi:hypothetical protein